MTVIETIALFGATLSSLVGAPATGWTESTYTAPVTTDKEYSAGLPIITNYTSGNLVVDPVSVQTKMVHLVQGTASGLSGGDPSWREPFDSIKNFESWGTTSWGSYTLVENEQLVRFVMLFTEEGTNLFTRTGGSPNVAKRTLYRTYDNRGRERREIIEF